MTHQASLDKTAKIITTIVTVLFAVIIISQYFFIYAAGRTAPIATVFICLLVYFAAYALKPLNYTITGGELIIHRLILDVRIKRTDIKSAEILDKEKLNSSIKLIGNGGLFGYYGKFKNNDLGIMTWYATRKDKIVFIETVENKKIILTPDDPKGLVSELNQ